MKIVVGIATSGRPHILSRTVAFLNNQERPVDLVVICPSQPSDADPAQMHAYRGDLHIVSGPKGTCHQRNAIIEQSLDADLLIFIDDDFVADPGFVRRTEALFRDDPTVMVATGHVLADGILTKGLTFDEATRIIGSQTDDPQETHEIYNGYGCNMVVRMAPVRDHRLRFDERLPLYAWQEDVDFSRQLARFGRVVKDARLRGVHLGDKRGRSSGRAFGYSQIANPIYLSRKGTVSWRHSLLQIARNVASNLAHGVSPEPWVDRRGRLRGNMLGFRDLVTRRLDPERILGFR